MLLIKIVKIVITSLRTVEAWKDCSEKILCFVQVTPHDALECSTNRFVDSSRLCIKLWICEVGQ